MPASLKRPVRGSCGMKSASDKDAIMPAPTSRSMRTSPKSWKRSYGRSTSQKLKARRKPLQRPLRFPRPPPSNLRPLENANEMPQVNLQVSERPEVPGFAHLESFLRHLRVERGVSPRTLINYRADLQTFLLRIQK